MIAKVKRKSGSSGSCLGYMLGDRLDKDQQIRVVSYNGFALSNLKIAELEKVPTTNAEKKNHKKQLWKIANDLSRIFDARAGLADYRVEDPFEDYILSCINDERERLFRVPTTEERAKYGMPEQNDSEADNRTLWQIIVEEFLAKMGIHGEIEKKLRRMKDGKKYMIKKTVMREAMFLAVAHNGTTHPHIHLLVARPDADGKVNDTRNERRRIVSVVQELSTKYKLSLKMEDYKVDLERTNEGYAMKILMRDLALEALKSATSHDDLKEKLAGAGIIPTWKKHSDNGKAYGILFTKIDKYGNEHTWSGTQLDRSLSYGKVEAALARNLVARQAQEDADRIAAQQEFARKQEKRKAEVIKINDIMYGFNSVFLPMSKGTVNLYSVKNKAYQLMKAAGDAGVVISKETAEKYNDLRKTWNYFDCLNQERRDIKDVSIKIAAIGGILMTLNPIIGLTVMFLAKISRDIRLSRIKDEKKQLLERVASIRFDISQLQEQKAKLKIEKQERLQEYLNAKQMLHGYNEGLQSVDNTVHEAHIEMLKEEFPFRNKGHMQYIIHGPHDASIFRAEETNGVYRSVPTGRYNDYDKEHKHYIKADYYEEARQALKDKVMFVAGDRGPKDFYETLLEEQKQGNYRVGDIQIHPDGKITFGMERVFGDSKLTEQSVPKIEEPLIQKPTLGVVQAATPPTPNRSTKSLRPSW